MTIAAAARRQAPARACRRRRHRRANVAASASLRPTSCLFAGWMSVGSPRSIALTSAACGSRSTASRCSLISAAQPLSTGFDASWSPAGEADDQERQLRIAKLRAPVRHPCREPAIVAGLTDVGFALVPGDPVQPERRQAARSSRCRWSRRPDDCSTAAPAVSRLASAMREYCQPLPSGLRCAVGEASCNDSAGPIKPPAPEIADVDDDLVGAGVKHTWRKPVVARRSGIAAAANGHAVDERSGRCRRSRRATSVAACAASPPSA